MSKFTGAYITNTGKEMLFGSKNLTYTKVILYDQDLSQTAIDQVRALTSLDNPLLTTQIGLADTKSDQVIVEATFKNDRVNQDINFKSVGWYAKTDTRPESLIAVSVIDGVKTLGANSPDQVSTSSINLKLAMAIDDATTVNLTGMICDGAKPSCALKVTTGVSTAVLSAMMAMEDRCVTSVEGIIDEDVDQSIRNLTRIGSQAMNETDKMVLDIMTHKGGC